jgi:hypothetical protein
MRMRYSTRGAHQEAADTLSASGAGRQKPGHVIVKWFCDPLGATTRTNRLLRHLNTPERYAMKSQLGCDDKQANARVKTLPGPM